MTQIYTIKDWNYTTTVPFYTYRKDYRVRDEGTMFLDRFVSYRDYDELHTRFLLLKNMIKNIKNVAKIV